MLRLAQASRRKFLSLAACSPFVAKPATDQIISGLLRNATTGLGNSSAGAAMLEPEYGETNATTQAWYDKCIKAYEYVEVFGLPEAAEAGLRERAKMVYHLDHDIANKCWSMSVKIISQRQRNYERELETMRLIGWRKKKIKALKSILGFDWPWG